MLNDFISSALKDVEYFNTSSDSPWRRSEASLRPLLQRRPKTTSPLVFHPLCLTWLTCSPGAVGKHCQSSEHKGCGVIIHHRKMRPLTGSGGKKKHKALCSSPPSSEECAHCKPVSSWGTPHPGTFIFNL